MQASESSREPVPAPPPAPPPIAPPRVWQRFVRLGVGVVLALAGLVGLAPVGGYLWLTSARGEAFVRARVLALAGERLGGRLELDRVSLGGLMTLEIQGFRLYAPGEEAPVLTIESATAEVRLAALLARRLELARVEVERPALRLATAADGKTNLARALRAAPAGPPGPAVAGPPFDLAVHVGAARVRHGAFSRDGADPIAATEVTLDGSLSGRLRAFTAEVTASTQLTAPLARPVTVRWRGGYDADGLITAAPLELGTGASRAKLTAELRAAGFDEGRLELEELVVAAADVAALPAAWRGSQRLLGDVRATGTAALDGGRLSAAVKATLPSGTLELDAEATVGLPAEDGEALHWKAKVNAQGIEPQLVLEGLPVARVELAASAEGAGLWPAGLVTIVADASGSRWNRLALPKATTTTEVRGRELQVKEAVVHAAGATATARGTAGLHRGSVRVELAVPDVARTRGLLARGLGLELPEAQGDLVADAEVSGAWRAPAITAQVKASRFALGTTELRGVAGKVGLRAWRPELHADADLTLEGLTAGGLEGGKLAIVGRVDGRRVTADVDGVLGGTPILARVRGVREPAPGVERWRLETLAARALGVQMHSERPSTVELGSGRVTVRGLEMTGDLGRIALAGVAGAAGPLDLTATVEGLRLEKLPASLKRGLPMSGLVSGRALLTGTAKEPRLVANVDVVEGRWDTLAPLTLHADGSYGDARIHAKARATLPRGGEAAVDLRLPVAALEDRTQPIEADVTFGQLDLTLAAPFSEALEGVSGRLSGAVEARGSLGDPEGSVHVTLTDGQARGFDTMSGGVQAKLEAGTLVTRAFAARPRTLGVTLEASAPFRLQPWLEAPRPDWREVPVKGSVALEHLDLAWLRRVGYGSEDVDAIVSGTLDFSGTSRTPAGGGAFRLTSARYRELKALDAAVTLQAGESVAVGVTLKASDRPLATGRLTAATSLGKLAQAGVALLEELPLDGELTLQPTPLRSVQALLGTRGETGVDGELAGSVQLDGTLNAPRATLAAAVPKVLLQGREVGKLDLSASYLKGRTTGLANFVSPGESSLYATTVVLGELGLGDLRQEQRARTARGAPDTLGDVLKDRSVTSTLKARAFELALLNGFSASVTDLAGKLDADVKQTGTLGAPELAGTMKLADGRMAIPSFGEFQGLAVDAALDAAELRVTSFSGRGRSGSFEGSALATLQDGFRRARGTLQLRTRDMPIVQNFQTRATLSMRSQTQWRIENRTFVADVSLSEGLMRIPEKLPRRVQDLEPHPDYVMTGEERPTTREAALAAAARWKGEITLTVPDNFKIEAPQGTDLWIGMKLGIHLHDRPLRQTGAYLSIGGPDRETIRVPRGTVNLLGKRFEIDPRSRVSFIHDDYADPELAIKAVHSGKDGTTVTVDIGGTAQTPKPSFSSKPSMDEAEIFFYLTTGQRQTRAQEQTPSMGQSLADTGLTVAGSVFGGLAKSMLERIVPVSLDVLTVETDIARQRGSLRAGKYVTERFYVGGQVNQSFSPQPGENVFEGEVEYQFDDARSFYFRGGDQGRFGAELLWRRNIPTKEQERAAEERK